MADSTATTPATPSAGGMSTTTLALIAVAVLVFGAFLYTKMKAASAAVTPNVGSGAGASSSTAASMDSGLLVSTNPVDPQAIALRKQNLAKYEPFKDGESNLDYNKHIVSAYGDDRSAADIKAGKGINYKGAYVDGFMKGMNLRQTVPNFNAWKNYIDSYMDNDNKQYHWDVQIGQYLK